MSDLNRDASEGATENNKPTIQPETISTTESRGGPATSIEINQQEKSIIEAQSIAREAKSTQEKTLDAVKKSERIALWIAAIVAVATIGQLITSCINNTSTSKQTDRLIWAANKNAAAADKFRIAAERNATAAENFTIAAQGINVGVEDAVKKLNLQAGALKDSVTQATRLAHDTEIANQNASDADRPWVALIIQIPVFEEKKPAKAFVEVVSSGRRPAKVTAIHYSAYAYKVFPSSPRYQDVSSGASTGILVPGQRGDISFDISAYTTSEWFGKVTNPTDNTLFVYGVVEYQDLKDHSTHATWACYYYRPKSVDGPEAGFYNCDTYNDAT